MIKKTIFYITLILSFACNIQAYSISTNNADLIEVALAALRFPLNIAHHSNMTSTKAKNVLISRDSIRLASGLIGMYRHTCNKYNLGWLIKDLSSLVVTLQKPTEECKMQLKLSAGSSACYLIEAAACAAAALCCQSPTYSKAKSQKHFLLLQGIASLARTTQYFTAEPEFSLRAQVTLTLILLHSFALLSDNKASLDEISRSRPMPATAFTAIMNDLSNACENLTHNNNIFNITEPNQDIEFDRSQAPEITYSQNAGITINRKDINGNQHEKIATERTNNRISPGEAFVILPCDHIFTSRQAERYVGKCKICQNQSSEESFSGWWGQLPENNSEISENIPLAPYTEEVYDQLAKQRGEEFEQLQINL